MKSRLYTALPLLGLVFLSACGNGSSSDFSKDNSFNIGSGMDGTVFSISPATDGSSDVYVGGSFTDINGLVSNRLVRMNSNGTVDTSFNIGSGMDSDVISIAPATDGDVYVGGSFTSVNGSAPSRLVRMNSNGTVDSGFDIGSGMNGSVSSIALATDGSGDVYVGGSFTTINGVTYNRLVRMNKDGSVDSGFKIGIGMNGSVSSIALATDGSGDVYVGGSFSTINGFTYNRLVRMNSDGSVDSDFNIGSGMNDSVSSIAPATGASGDIYVGGSFTTVKGVTYNRLVRMNNDGTVDTGFNIGSNNMSGSVFSIAPATGASGDIYVGGSFTTVNGTAPSRLVRMNSNGTVDTGFDIGSGMNGTVFSIAPAIDGSADVYVGGSFTTVNTILSNRLVGLNSDGSVE